LRDLIKITMMNKLKYLLFAFSLFLFLPSFSQDNSASVKWYSVEEAEKLTKENPKKWLIDIYTDWCGWCKKMDKETFNHPVIAEYINEHYYAVKLNAESRDSITFNGTIYRHMEQGGRGYQELAVNLLNGQMSYPSIAYLNEKMQLLGAVPGYKTPQSIEPLLNYIVEDKFTSESLSDYQKTFKSKLTE
jgi:thioredoxin-related protein